MERSRPRSLAAVAPVSGQDSQIREDIVTRHSRGWRAFIVSVIVAWNVLPFIPVWPGYSGGGDSWTEGLAPFLFLNAGFWLIVVVLWLTGSGRSPRRRAVIAEVPAIAQALFF